MWIIIGIIVLAYLILKDECTVDVTKDHDVDFNKMYIDSFKVSKSEFKRRIRVGYYNTPKQSDTPK